MAEGRQEGQWAQTAEILSMVYNAHRSLHARPRSPAEFNPFAGGANDVKKSKDLTILRDLFVKDHQ